MSFNLVTFNTIALPKIIYKYRDWKNERHRRILTHNEIYFAAPLDCDEQHECNLPRDYDSIDNAKLYQYYYQTASEHGAITNEERHSLATQMVKEPPFNKIEHRNQAEHMFRQTLNERLSIFCVSEHKDNNNLWNVFANNQTGFCVGINPKKMFQQTEVFGSGRKIDYYPTANPPTIRPFCLTESERVDDMLKVIYSLPDIYGDEDEYRLSKIDIEKREAIIPTDCYEEIILGSNISVEDKKEIVSIAKSNFKNCKLFQALCDDKHQLYSFELIA